MGVSPDPRALVLPADMPEPVRTHCVEVGKASHLLMVSSPFVNPTDAYFAIAALSNHIHALNVLKGWWSDPATGARKERNVGEVLMLCVSEIAEAIDSVRVPPDHIPGQILDPAKCFLPDDHLPELPGMAVEIADFIIRVCDASAGYQWDIAAAFSAVGVSLTARDELNIGSRDPSVHGAAVIRHVSRGFELARKSQPGGLIAMHMAKAVLQAIGWALVFRMPLGVAIAEKTAFNQIRKDHTLAERMRPDGKKI